MLVAYPSQMLKKTSITPVHPAGKKRRSRAKKKFDLLGLPNEILLMVFDYLDVFDSATLALTSKRLASIALTHSKLDFPTNTTRRYAAWMPHQERHFLKKRLGDKFFSKRDRYCWSCKHYVPRRKGYWKRKLIKKGWEVRVVAHSMAKFGDWWNLPQTQQMLNIWNKGQAFKCPRCKLCRASYS
jgi:F-box-like